MMHSLLFIVSLFVPSYMALDGQNCNQVNDKLDQIIALLNKKEFCQGPSSCREIYQSNSGKENKAYLLHMDTGNVPVYCHMTDTGIGRACGGGGWTLVMKIDGRKRTFHYDSPYWTDRMVYATSQGETGFDEQETKLPTYWNTPFTKICLGMKLPGQGEIRFIQIPMETSKNSLYELIGDGQYRPIFVGRDAWKTLIGQQASLQANCNREGFNVISGHNSYSKVRIGFMANQENDCLTGDSRIGFGSGGHQDDSNTCGNEATHYADNGDKHIKAIGYILVQ